MKILVGVPVFRIRDLTRVALYSVAGTLADLIVVDNAADADIKNLLNTEFMNVKRITNEENGFCNGGWNQIMEYGLANEYDIIGLGSSDVVIHSGWQNVLKDRAERYNDEVWVPKEKSSSEVLEEVEYPQTSVAGFYMFLPRKAVEIVYPIPSKYKHWFGDQHIFDTLRSQGWKVTILNRMTASHQQSAVTFVTPEAYDQIEKDLVAHDPTYIPPKRIRYKDITVREQIPGSKPVRFHTIQRRVEY